MATCEAAAENAEEDDDEGSADGCNEVGENPSDKEVEEEDDDDEAAVLRKSARLTSVAAASPCPCRSFAIWAPDPDPDPAQLTLLATFEGLAADSDVSLLEHPPESLKSSLSLHISSMSSSSIFSMLNLPYLFPICLLLPVMRFLCRLIIRRTLYCPSTISSLVSVKAAGKQLVIDVESLLTK